MKAALVLLLLLLSTTALADTRSEADALFEKAKKLHAGKKYADACPMFEKSDALDPGIGAKLNVAKCYEDWGMLARAHRWYTDAEAMAKSARDKRAPKIRELIDELDPDVPRLTVNVPDGMQLQVSVDARPIEPGKPLLVDPGPHEITWRVAGKKKSKTIAIERGAERELTLETKASAADRSITTTTDDTGTDTGTGRSTSASPSRPGRGRRILGVSLGVAGLAGLGVASYLTLDARSTYDDALDTHCMGAKDMCTDEGLRITGDARSRANTATIISVVSLVAIAGGIVLYLTAPDGRSSKETNKTALYVTPVVSHDSGGLVLGGGF